MLTKIVLLIALATSSLLASAQQQMKLLTAADLANFENPKADTRILYGGGPLQFGDLRVPPGDGPHPVAVFLHGGCWLAEYDINHTSKLMAALTRNGIATWSLEYRRVGDEGGGWPGTFLDVGRGTDHLRSIAGEHHLDLDRVIVGGPFGRRPSSPVGGGALTTSRRSASPFDRSANRARRAGARPGARS